MSIGHKDLWTWLKQLNIVLTFIGKDVDIIVSEVDHPWLFVYPMETSVGVSSQVELVQTLVEYTFL